MPSLDDHGPVARALTVAPSQPSRGEIVVRLRGELDILTSPRCQRVLRLAVRAVAQEAARPKEPPRSGSGCVVCDLDGVDFLAASALTMFLEIAEEAQARGVEFVLVGARRPVHRLLSLTGLEGHFSMSDRWETATDGVGVAKVAS